MTKIGLLRDSFGDPQMELQYAQKERTRSWHVIREALDHNQEEACGWRTAGWGTCPCGGSWSLAAGAEPWAIGRDEKAGLRWEEKVIVTLLWGSSASCPPWEELLTGGESGQVNQHCHPAGREIRDLQRWG